MFQRAPALRAQYGLRGLTLEEIARIELLGFLHWRLTKVLASLLQAHLAPARIQATAAQHPTALRRYMQEIARHNAIRAQAQPASPWRVAGIAVAGVVQHHLLRPRPMQLTVAQRSAVKVTRQVGGHPHTVAVGLAHTHVPRHLAERIQLIAQRRGAHPVGQRQLVARQRLTQLRQQLATLQAHHHPCR